MTADTGKCMFCDQIVFLEKHVPEEQADEVASLACNCTEGQGYRRRAARVEKANGNIDLAFHEHQPQVAKLLKQAVPMLIDYQIAKISVDTGAGIKGVMSVTSKGSLKVEKAASKK